MKVAIIGIARSGTTALYSLMQEIMVDVHKDVQFVYEPFLWDKDVFNARYHEIGEKFNTINSISVEGIYQHQTLPLFIDDPGEHVNNSYLNDIFKPQDHEYNLLAKVIRANGRVVLLNRICPELKIIYILRNPLDSVNSILSLFSYYGGEFHHDDYPRFIEGVRYRFGLNFTAGAVLHQIEKELLYWYYMNLFALQTMRKQNIRPLIISFENYSKNPELIVSRICEHLHYPVKDEYHRYSKREEGVVTREFNISREEMNCVLPYLGKYQQLLKEYSIENAYIQEDVLGKYLVNADESFRVKHYYGLNPLLIVNRVEELQKQLKEKDEIMAGR